MKDRRRKGLFGRLLEWVAFGAVLAVPVLYFAWPRLQLEDWLERVNLRNPILIEPRAAAGQSADSDAAGTAAIYRCVNDGATVLSDRPCGNVVEKMELPPRNLNVVPAEAIAGTNRAREEGSATCRSFDAELEEIDANLRAGHSMQRGEELKARRAALLERGRATGCY